MMRRILGTAMLAAALAACNQAPPADPQAQAWAQCADASAPPLARKSACDTLLAAPNLSSADRADALVHRGEARRGNGDPTAALADYTASLAIDGSNAEAKLGRAEVLLTSGQLDAAAALIESVMREGALPARAHLLRGDLKMRQGDPDAALIEFNASIGLDAHQSAAFAERGLVKQRQQDYAGAARDFDTALHLNSRETDALAGRCWNAIFQNGDLGRAGADAEAALGANGSLISANLCHGLVQLKQQDWAGARSSYDAVLTLDAANAAALWGRGYARRKNGEDHEGAEDIRRAYDFNSHVDQEFKRYGVEL